MHVARCCSGVLLLLLLVVVCFTISSADSGAVGCNIPTSLVSLAIMKKRK
jgi:hypothetical protein